MKTFLFRLLNLFNKFSPIQIFITETVPYTEEQTQEYVTGQLDSITTNFVKDIFWVKFFSTFPELGQQILESNKPILELIDDRDKQVRAIFRDEMEQLERGLRKNVNFLIGLTEKQK